MLWLNDFERERVYFVFSPLFYGSKIRGHTLYVDSFLWALVGMVLLAVGAFKAHGEGKRG